MCRQHHALFRLCFRWKEKIKKLNLEKKNNKTKQTKKQKTTVHSITLRQIDDLTYLEATMDLVMLHDMESRKYIDVDFYHYSIHFSMNFSHYELYMYVLPTCIYITKCLKEEKRDNICFLTEGARKWQGLW